MAIHTQQMRDSGLVDPEVDFDEVAEMLPRVSGELERTTRTVCSVETGNVRKRGHPNGLRRVPMLTGVACAATHAAHSSSTTIGNMLTPSSFASSNSVPQVLKSPGWYAMLPRLRSIGSCPRTAAQEAPT